jgi:hypothetical protein
LDGADGSASESDGNDSGSGDIGARILPGLPQRPERHNAARWTHMHVTDEIDNSTRLVGGQRTDPLHVAALTPP